MRNPKNATILSVFVAFTLIACGYSLAAPPETASDEAISRYVGLGKSPFGENGVIVIADVVDCKTTFTQQSLRSIRECILSVICSSKSSLNEKRITVSGKGALYGSSKLLHGVSGEMGDYTPGQVVVLVVEATADPLRFKSFDRPALLAMGIACPATVSKDQKNNLVNALRELNRINSADSTNAKTLAGKCLSSKNPYKWAIGATCVARQGTAKEREDLVDVLDDGTTQLENAVWLVELLEYEFPPSARPSTAEIEVRLREFLYRHIRSSRQSSSQ